MFKIAAKWKELLKLHGNGGSRQADTDRILDNALKSIASIFWNLKWFETAQGRVALADWPTQSAPWLSCEAWRRSRTVECASSQEVLARDMMACSRCGSVRYCSVGSSHPVSSLLMRNADAGSASSLCFAPSQPIRSSIGSVTRPSARGLRGTFMNEMRAGSLGRPDRCSASLTATSTLR